MTERKQSPLQRFSIRSVWWRATFDAMRRCAGKIRAVLAKKGNGSFSRHFAGRDAGRLLKRSMRGESYIWQAFYAWFPVFPIDEGRVFWLEQVWRRRNKKTGRWQYRSFRDEDAKLVEQINREI